MRFYFIIFFIFAIIFFIFLVSCIVGNNPNNYENTTQNMTYLSNNKEQSDFRISNLLITTDKPLYHSNENMHIVVSFDVSDLDISKQNNLTINLKGISNRLNHKNTIILREGNNRYTYNFKTPRCNVCAGIREGDYKIEAIISFHNYTYKNSTTLRIEQ